MDGEKLFVAAEVENMLDAAMRLSPGDQELLAEVLAGVLRRATRLEALVLEHIIRRNRGLKHAP